MTSGTDRDGNRRALGAAGESVAARHLERRGYRILEMNVRCRFGEIDLVALDAGVVGFIEVKGKRGGRYGVPEEMVTLAKQRRLTHLARWYLQRRGWLGRPARFDVIAVDWGSSGESTLRHVPNAFPVCGGW